MRAVSVSPQTVGGYQGLRILDMQSGSYIEELGLRKDDLLLGANGKPLRGFGDLGGSEIWPTRAPSRSKSCATGKNHHPV